MIFNENSSDEELMQAYQNGIEQGFNLLFKRHSPRVYGFLMNQLKNRSQADDVFQATFLKLHQSRRLYDPQFPFAPWLFTICKSVLIDHKRKSQKNLEDNDEQAVSNFAHDIIPEGISRSNNMDSLGDRERHAIELRYGEDLPFDEIARRLKTSPGNVRQLVSRGIKNLRILSGKGGD